MALQPKPDMVYEKVCLRDNSQDGEIIFYERSWKLTWWTPGFWKKIGHHKRLGPLPEAVTHATSLPPLRLASWWTMCGRHVRRLVGGRRSRDAPDTTVYGTITTACHFIGWEKWEVPVRFQWPLLQNFHSHSHSKLEEWLYGRPISTTPIQSVHNHNFKKWTPLTELEITTFCSSSYRSTTEHDLLPQISKYLLSAADSNVVDNLTHFLLQWVSIRRSSLTEVNALFFDTRSDWSSRNLVIKKT